MTARLAMSLHRDLTPILGTSRLLSACVSPVGDAILLFAAPDDGDVAQGVTEQKRWATFPHARAEREYAARVALADMTQATTTELRGMSVAHPHIQQLTDGRWLVVGARCRYRPDHGAEHNAIIFDTLGERVRDFTLGDGITDVQVSSGGTIWVSYFDEGVYGNYG